MIRVIIESPFAGGTPQNRVYLQSCIMDSLMRGEAPFASHGFYPAEAGGPLDDSDPDDRELGIAAGFAWREAAELTAVYADLGISRGMAAGIADAKAKGRPWEYRRLAGIWSR